MHRDRLFSVVKAVDPEGVYNRSCQLQRRRGEYITRGPDWVWSIDAHCKFERFDIQIYAAIDAFSRFIIWIYVGVSSRTMISVFKQFITAVESRGATPHMLRADKGLETIIAADAQYHLAKIARSRAGEEHCTFKSTFVFGTSTLNQRIEAWWAQMSRALLSTWLVRRSYPCRCI